jgi:hypothetical protein
MRLLSVLVFAAAALAQDLPANDPHAADRQQLLRIFGEIEGSINSQSLERMAQQMDANAVVVWANGDVSRGPAQVLDYYERMVKGKDRILTKYLTKAKLNGHARFLGDGSVAIADGTMEDEYFPVIRGPFQLSAKWTTTAAKINGEWKVVALHLSANVFNNVLIDEAKAALLYTTLGGLAIGALGGYGLCWFLKRRR